MQGKNTVLFITNDSFRSAPLIRNELDKDTTFIGVTVDFHRLENKVKSFFKKPYIFLKAYIWTPISKVLHKMSPKVTVPKEPRACNIAANKKVQNMLFRFSPSAIIVNDPTVRFSITMGLNSANKNVPIYVYSDEFGFNEDLISDSVSHYFVDNISVRDQLIDLGIPSEKIDVNPLPVSEEYHTKVEEEKAKQIIGEGSGVLCAVFLCGGQEIDFPTVSGIKFITEDKESGIAESDLYQAADIIVTRFDPHVIKQASALKKPIVLYLDSSDNKTEAEYLVAEGRALAVKDEKELEEVLDEYMNEGLDLSQEDTDPRSAEKIAAKIRELVSGAE